MEAFFLVLLLIGFLGAVGTGDFGSILISVVMLLGFDDITKTLRKNKDKK